MTWVTERSKPASSNRQLPRGDCRSAIQFLFSHTLSQIAQGHEVTFVLSLFQISEGQRPDISKVNEPSHASVHQGLRLNH